MDVVVSAGKEQVQVPDLIDFSSVADARKALADAGLAMGKVTEEDSDKPEGTVLRQDPEAYETVDAGSQWTSGCPTPRSRCPTWSGRTEAQARTDLFNQGFEVAYAPEVETTEFAPGTVVEQTPEGGESAKKGSLVTLTLAKAPAPDADPDADPERAGRRWWRGRAGGRRTANGNPGLSASPVP